MFPIFPECQSFAVLSTFVMFYSIKARLQLIQMLTAKLEYDDLHLLPALSVICLFKRQYG